MYFQAISSPYLPVPPFFPQGLQPHVLLDFTVSVEKANILTLKMRSKPFFIIPNLTLAGAIKSLEAFTYSGFKGSGLFF